MPSFRLALINMARRNAPYSVREGKMKKILLSQISRDTIPFFFKKVKLKIIVKCLYVKELYYKSDYLRLFII